MAKGNITNPFASQSVREKRSPTKPGRVDLMPAEFDNLIEDQGIKVLITPAALCPNRDMVEGTNHKLDCPICHGDEVLEITGKAIETWAFIQGVNLERRYEANGLFDIKDSQMTVPANVRISYMYKVEVLDFSSTFNELIMRGKRGPDANSDYLRYRPTEDSNVPLYVVDSTGREYTRNEHYEIDKETKTIKWKNQYRPAANVMYSILYPTLPTFRVVELLHESRFYYRAFKKAVKEPVSLPQQALLRLDYLAVGSGAKVPR
jgi:hypothetical protein